jgi:glycosyltransferase involved in cell wall biosynthesis
MKRLRIAVYHNLHSGGAKRVTAGHLHSLSKRHDVTLYSLRGADHEFAVDGTTAAYAIKLYDHVDKPMLRSPFGRLNPLLRMQNAERMDETCKRIAADIDTDKHDVVLAHPCQMTNAPTVLKWLKTSSLYYLHEWPRKLYEPAIDRPYAADGASSGRAGVRRALNRLDPLISTSADYFRKLDRDSARAATRIATNSNYTRNNAEPVYQRPVDVCYLGVDADAYESTQSPPLRERVVLSVGSLTPAKGFDFVIQALGTLPRDANGCRPPLVLISNFQEAAERDYVTALAQRNGVPLKLLVRVSDDELKHWYRRAACLAYAPVREPFGLVALEAMASGAPIVAVAEGGVRESVLDAVTGLVAPREPQAFGQAIQQLLDDAAFAQHLANRAHAHVLAHWTWEQHVAKLEDMLQSVANQSK